MFLALAVRVYMVLTAGVITPDGILYIKIARFINDGNWRGVYEDGFYSTYPFVIVLFQKVFHDWETAGRMASAAAGSVAVLPFFFLLRRMFDLRIAFVASIFFVIGPRLVQYSSDVLREPLFWCFSITSLWAAWKGIEEKRWVFIAAASFFAGLSCFTRTEGVALLAIVIVWMGWVLFYRERKARLFLAFLMVFLVAFPAMSITPLYLLKSKAGAWELGHLATKIPELLQSRNKPLPVEIDGSSLKSRQAGSVLTRVMSNRYVFSLWETSHKFFRSFHVVLIVLLLFGLFRRRIIPCSGKEIPVLIWCSAFFLISLVYAFKVSYVSTRHGLLVGIPSLLWVSIGFWELSSRMEGAVRKARWSPKLTRHVAVYLLILICLSVIPRTVAPYGDEKIEMKKAGIYLKRMGYSNEKFAVEPRINRLTFYKGGDFVNIPTNIDPVALGRFLKSADVRFLVVDERTIENAVKGFKGNTDAMNLEKVDLPGFNDYREYSFAVYRIGE